MWLFSITIVKLYRLQTGDEKNIQRQAKEKIFLKLSIHPSKGNIYIHLPTLLHVFRLLCLCHHQIDVTNERIQKFWTWKTQMFDGKNYIKNTYQLQMILRPSLFSFWSHLIFAFCLPYPMYFWFVDRIISQINRQFSTIKKCFMQFVFAVILICRYFYFSKLMLRFMSENAVVTLEVRGLNPILATIYINWDNNEKKTIRFLTLVSLSLWIQD